MTQAVKPKKLVIIDGKSVFYRGFYAMPSLATSQGQPTGGVYGFAVMGLRILQDLKPDYVIVAWDKAKTNIRARRELYAGYKANRKPMPEDLRQQIPYLEKLLEGFGWPLLEIDDFEADDIMATLARQARAEQLETVLVTSDLDVLQAVNGETTVCALKKGLTNVVMYTRDKFSEEYGMTPEQFIDYKALKGDSSDNVPGVAGVGDKTAKDLVQRFGSLEKIYENLSELPSSLQAKLEKDRDMAFLSHRLLEIRFDAPVKLELSAAEVAHARPELINGLLTELEFTSLKKQLPPYMQPSAETVQLQAEAASKDVRVTQLRTVQELAAALQPARELLVHTLTFEESVGLPAAQALIISCERGTGFIVELGKDISFEAAAKTLQKTFESEQVPKIGFNLKNDYKAWRAAGIRLEPVGFDVMVAAFLINPLIRQKSLAELAESVLGMTVHGLDGGQLMPPAELGSQIVSVLWKLYDHYRPQLASIGRLDEVAHTQEWPLIPILGEMEYTGIRLDVLHLETMSKELEAKILQIEQVIYKEAGQQFNINSPQQLQMILFEKLRLPTVDIKKLKSGFSTAASELDKLRHMHPIIQLMSDYRELTKLKSTYVDALPKLVDKNGRLHTSFNQTVAQTGRLSSDNPNLQNIPIRSELGKLIRRAFVASPGTVLVSADYSQFELRLAAVLSNDIDTIEAFNSGIDIHTQTAAEVYGVALEDVTPEQRRNAKVINFGIMYGMSPHGLSVATGMDYTEANKFIKKYFEIRVGLLEYLESLKKKAREEGYVETMFGRRRPMPDIKSSNFAVRQAAERAAINMPIQGTEADLMKLAMIELDKKLGSGCNMLLQIHDSILLECPKAEAEATAALVKETMENIHPLSVWLDVDIHIGPNWGELE